MGKLIDLHTGDALPWLRTLPAGSVHLWVTSPPYEDARQYSGERFPSGEAWVRWYRPYLVEMCRAGLLAAVNVAGCVRDHRYSGVPEMLVADAIRLDGLAVGPAPYAWVKNAGIFGSGGKRYHRRDWEPVYLFARPENLPPVWTDNTAFGAPPRHRPGGNPSHRTKNGGRVGGKPYKPPAVANPGNVLDNLPELLAGDVIGTGNGGGQTGHKEAHGNEAPMNLAVAERLVCWYAPPGALVGDPMCGSGTTGEAALRWDRRFVGCDLRESEVIRTARRLSRIETVGRRPTPQPPTVKL